MCTIKNKHTQFNQMNYLNRTYITLIEQLGLLFQTEVIKFTCVHSKLLNQHYHVFLNMNGTVKQLYQDTFKRLVGLNLFLRPSFNASANA